MLDRLAQDEALVPSVWPLEIGNVLLVAERRKRLSEADSAHFLALLAELPIMIEPEPPQRMLREIIALARELGLSTYDAAYLDLAMRGSDSPSPLTTQPCAKPRKKCRCRS